MEEEVESKEHMIQVTKETMDPDVVPSCMLKVLAIDAFVKDVDRMKEVKQVILQVEEVIRRYEVMLQALEE